MTDQQDTDERSMKFSREVRIGELIAALVAISAMATGYIELRLRPVEQQIAAVEKASNLQGEQAAEFKRDLRTDLQRVESKLDRLIEALQVRAAR
jgi:hypothetical protein